MRRACQADLPPCLTRFRQYLDVTRTVGSVDQPQPGDNCPANCPYRLCPYPAIGEKTYRAEVSEGLCRQLASNGVWSWFAGASSWQRRTSPRALRKFWTAMGNRSLPPARD